MAPKSSKKRVRVNDTSDSEDEPNASPTAEQGLRMSPYKTFQPIDKDLRILRAVPKRQTSWYEMVRVLNHEDDASKNVPGLCGQHQQLSSWMVNAILDVSPLSSDAPDPNGCWTCVAGHQSWAEGAPQVVLDVLRFVIQAEDARLTGKVWMIIKKRARTWKAAHELIRSNKTFAQLLFKDKPDQVIKTIAFLALVSRRPRLLNAVLDGYTCHVATADQCFDEHTDGVSLWQKRKVNQNLTCVALAIVDCVFGPDHSVSYEASYKAHVERNNKATANTETALCLASWREAVEKIVALCDAGTPMSVWACGPGEHDHPYVTKQVSILELAVHTAELCPEFLDNVLDARSFPAHVIESAMRAAISARGVRGPNLARILPKLYAVLLYEWKQQPAKRERGSVCQSDELATVWRNLVVTASGYDAVETGSGGNASVPMSPFLAKMEKSNIPMGDTSDHACMRHPEEWKGIFDAMIACHDSNSGLGKEWSYPLADASLWDTTSPLFESIIRQVVIKLMDEPQKTKLLLYFIKQLDDGRGKGKGPPSWLFIPNLFHTIALHHPLALGMVLEHAAVDSFGIKHTHVDDNGKDTGIPAPLNSYHEALNTALVFCVSQKRRQSVRLLVNALRGHVQTPVVYYEDDQETTMGFLPYYVKMMGDGATEEERNKHGEDYGAFINTIVEKDFKMMIGAMDWSVEALKGALRFASFYQRPICAAQLLSAPHFLSADDDAYLMAIAAWLHEPDNQGAKVAESNFLAARACGASSSQQP